MLIGVRKEQELADHLSQQQAPPQSYWSIVRQQFRKNRMAVWSLRVLYLLGFIALFADFIANEKPIYAKLDGESHFPVFRSYAVGLGLDSWEARFFQNSWHEHDYDYVIWAPIPYSAQTMDRNNRNYVAPGDEQDVPSTRFRHWLGTDQLGRDVAAGMIAGTRTAMLVGIVAMSIAAVIGIFLGALAGYFGDERFSISRIRLALNGLGAFLAYFYGFQARSFALSEGTFGWEIFKSLALIAAIMSLVNLLAVWLKGKGVWSRPITIPLDLGVMRLIEVVNSIPGLLLILSIVAIIEEQSVFYIMAIIGLIGWTGIARFIRAELLRVRNLEYIEAAQALGYSEWRIIARHAIPNALTPVLITIAFGIASAILMEAFLSFLGIGVAAEEVTWGSLLNLARSKFSAWWLAIFPGLAIFVTVTVFNLLGEGLTDALDPRRKQ
ncbi:ABC transporter permease [Phaeodactylibacter sp.]|jgi:peptide/nickel transport system permease protein|uniref:ABC transporter permease n=1 Tax=Phaeodactylibacter sp. TaxID=1940289 RepID=UPI0025FCFB5D|nr:ABC transporter permease [Phaeodactylibacter sp.]MCI4651129.1 ABC transporter permease [Phaeodactylibacter sp.]MCI5093687.1 ABC transporter permease [Phaeodactylibacter sp.]